MRNLTRDSWLGDAIEIADTGAKRRAGLLKRTALNPGEGLWIVPCEAIHSFFMQFAIDVLYLDRKRRVRKAVTALPPWRVSGCFVAHSTLELAAGTIRQSGTEAGDQLEFMKI